MERVQVHAAPAGTSLYGAFRFHLAAAIGLLPAMVGFGRAESHDRAGSPRRAAYPVVRRRIARRGNLIEAAMLAVAAAEAREAAERDG